MPEYRLANAAVVDLQGIADYGDERWGAAASDAFRERLRGRFERIAAQPRLYPPVDHVRQGYRRSVFEGLSIYYRIDDGFVVIARVIGRQEPFVPDEEG